MASSKVYLLILGLLLLPSTIYGQDPHVYSEYKERLKATIVYTDKMHLLDTPEQVIDVELNFRLPKSEKQPKRVDLMLWSHAKALKYQKEKGKDLTVIADGRQLRAEKVIYMPFQGSKDKSLERIKDAYVEWIILYLNPAEAKKLAGAKEVKLRLGAQELSFTDNQMNTVRDFADRIPVQ